ncbi:HAMP domain-containing sensor histidine kinase [Acidiferrobacter sp.]|uniref:two-component system sensor histidine kinase NtrB n=1 Tax=Acidiferrobacter sp. TaxID=1872107 RepID=UPI0026219B96|nr:HAMP domain-containing sensor histidine kinase [Acidiferrobacter sp.]
MSSADHALDLAADGVETPLLVREQNWLLLSYFNTYRLALALLACIAGFWAGSLAPFASTNPRLFLIVAVCYAGVYLAAIDTTRRRLGAFETQAAVLAFCDVVALILLMHASGGLGSGTGVLLLVSIAGTSFLLNRRMTIFFAALATIGILLERAWPYLTGAQSGLPVSYSQVGLFGLVLFATASLAHLVADRLRHTEALAQRQELDIRHLARLNDQIVQHLQSGVLVVAPTGHIRLANKTAQTYLGLTAPQPLLQNAAPALFAQWSAQRGDMAKGRQLFVSATGYTLLPRFKALGAEGTATLIFLEDTAILKQQAQQLKMAGLARLTAGIAHEIRNPLGAITHAAQLLMETPDLGPEPRNLAAIIDDQGRRMNTIVENVLQLGRRDRINATVFGLHDWLVKTRPAIATALNIPAQALNLVIERPQTVCFDTDHLFQIVNNLCHNSLKHSPPYHDAPIVKLLVGIDGEGLSTLDVIDWGEGIKEAIADRIFDPFFTTTARGTGLGLYIARELAEANGARLEHRPTPTGCQFRLTFGRLNDCTEASLTS